MSGLLGLGALLSTGCAAEKPPLRWVDEVTFVAPRATIIDEIRLSLGRDEYSSLRIAAALDHNCPLEDVRVALERRMASEDPRFVLNVCGFEHTYLELEGPLFVEVTPKPATSVAAAPKTGIDSPTAPTPNPAVDPEAKESPK